MTIIKRFVAISTLLAAVSVATLGCHTIEGAGKDIKSTGKAIEGAADKNDD